MKKITQFEEKFWSELRKELKTNYNIDITDALADENSLTFNNNNFLSALMGVLYQQTEPVKKALYTVLCSCLPKELRFEYFVSFDEFSKLIDNVINILINN